MRISVLIFVSLVVNLALAALLFRPHGPASVASDNGAIHVSPGAAADPSTVAPDTRFATPAASGKISWRDLQAAELKEFAGKLRAVNCPEETVKDLVLADLNRRFSQQQHALWSDQQNQDYWKPYRRNRDPEEQKKNRERSKQMQAMQKEKTALIVEIFGVDVEKQRMKEEGFDTESIGWNPNGDLAFLPEAKREAVKKYLDDFQEKMQDFYASTMGGWDAEARAKQKKLEQEKLAGLAQWLTPQELREYKLRNSQTASQISSDLHGVDLTRAQYEALFDLREKYGESIYNYGDANNDEAARKRIEQNKKDMQAEIAAVLGTDKSAELERAQDYQYQQLASLARHNDLPAETAPKIYDFKQAAEKAAEAVKTSQDLSPEERQAALAQIRAETETAVKKMLGEKLFIRYQRNGGWWLNNIASAPKQWESLK